MGGTAEWKLQKGEKSANCRTRISNWKLSTCCVAYLLCVAGHILNQSSIVNTVFSILHFQVQKIYVLLGQIYSCFIYRVVFVLYHDLLLNYLLIRFESCYFIVRIFFFATDIVHRKRRSRWVILMLLLAFCWKVLFDLVVIYRFVAKN